MRSDQPKFSYEEAALREDARRAAGDAESRAPRSVSELPDEVPMPRNGVLRARETALIAMSPEVVDRHRRGVEHILDKILLVLFAMGEQKHEIRRLREDTRQVLARLGAT